MGVGNYRCTTTANDVVYVDADEVFTSEDPDPHNDDAPFTQSDYRTFDWLDFIEAVKSIACDDWSMWAPGSPFSRDWYEDMRVVAFSRFYLIGLVDWEGYVAVVVSINDEMYDAKGYSLAKHNLHRTAEKMFNRLEDAGYLLRVRSCGWTSAPRTRSLAA